jgi:hypothetical protein
MSRQLHRFFTINMLETTTSSLSFRFPELKQQPIRSCLLEGLSRGFAKLASFAKNRDMGWSRINFISALQEDPPRCRISR